uniref:Secreted protein n=1 Tax=Anopheles epiroticus TaxID=199890 RepID=A0A182PX98_9DIPT
MKQVISLLLLGLFWNIAVLADGNVEAEAEVAVQDATTPNDNDESATLEAILEAAVQDDEPLSENDESATPEADLFYPKDDVNGE